MTDMLLRDGLERYRSQVSILKKGYAQEKYRIDQICRSFLGDKITRDVTSVDIATYRDLRLQAINPQTKKPLSPSTVRLEMSLLSNFFDIGRIEWGICGDNPVKNVRKPTPPPGRERRLTAREERQILRYCHNHQNQSLYSIVVIALETAMRQGEFLNLHWEHINLKSRIAHLPKTKNGAKRDVPLSVKARDALIRLGVQTRGKVFGYSAEGLKSTWRFMLIKLGIENLHFHDLRHEAISRLFELGSLDYADTNLRYLKATGLVQSKGRGLSLVPEKHLFIERLTAETGVPESDRAYFITLCNGAALPTDNQDSALAVLDDLLQQLRRRGIPYDVGGKPTDTPADIEIIRHQIEALLAEANEEAYAAQQAAVWEEIAAYMELIITRRNRKTLSNGEEIEVPQAEAPAYFEWVLWRAFLAINSLANKPYEARRFKIDQDFLPVGTAPGNGPDLIFEFDDFVLVVEVTLTANSRQEAAEGEPVRRHVADLVAFYQEQSGKPVYGLFIANRIDSNTAETFRIGIWYTNADEKMRLDIIPITLAQFKDVFEALFESGQVDVALIRELLEQCGSLRPTHEAPAWKREIAGVVQRTVGQLLQ